MKQIPATVPMSMIVSSIVILPFDCSDLSEGCYSHHDPQSRHALGSHVECSEGD